jgi:carboxypeptidase C (cathepsin A)
MGFLTNLVQVFPALATRPLHIAGESYAGASIALFLLILSHLPYESPEILHSFISTVFRYTDTNPAPLSSGVFIPYITKVRPDN